MRKTDDDAPDGLTRFLDWLTLGLWFVCLNASAMAEFDQFPSLEGPFARGWQIAAGYWIVLGLAAGGVWRAGLAAEFLRVWRRQLWLLAFLALAAASIFWSVDRLASTYEVLLLVAATVSTACLVLRFQDKRMLEALTWIAAVSTLLSLAIILFTPSGIMHGSGHAGSWRGLFWHRNHAGILMAFFSTVFLFRLLLSDGKSLRTALLLLALFSAAALHVFGSRSATGIIIFGLLTIANLLAYGWSRWRAVLRQRHYILAAASAVVLILVIVANLEFVFGLLGRSTTLTGRTSMWPDLLGNTYVDRPLVGHGFGAIWTQESFRVLVQGRWGWSYQPYFSDSGYLDLLLNLGMLGLLLFLGFFLQTIVRVLRLTLSKGAWPGAFFLLVLTFVAIANTTYSFLFEVDYFVWTLLVIVSFAAVPPQSA